MKLYEDTLRLVRQRMRTHTQQEIADAAGVGFEWLKKFARGTIPNAGVIRLQKLHDYLVSR